MFRITSHITRFSADTSGFPCLRGAGLCSFLKNARSLHTTNAKTLPSRLTSQNIIILPLREDKVNELTNYMLDEFVPDEPLNKCIGLERDDAAKVFTECVSEAAMDGMSFYAFDETKGRICGARINRVVKNRAYLQKADFDGLDYPHKMKYIIEILETCESNLFKHIPPDAKCFKLDMVSVSKDYQGRHIAKALIALTFDLIKSKTGPDAFTHLMTVATSFKTQNLYLNQEHFKSVFSITLNDFTAFDGTKPFANINTHVNPYVKLLVKETRQEPTD